MTLSEAAPAKLNLFLTIVGRRDDGYHRLDSLFAFVGCADRLTFEPAEDFSFGINGDFAAGLAGDDNLVVKAAHLLAAEAGLSPSGRLMLDKRVPVAAGVGGGSADAAAALRLLNRAWGLHWPPERLLPLAARLGADVPACVASRPVVARETGEDLSPAPAMPPCGILLVNPRVPTPTPAVFGRFRQLNPVIAPQTHPLLPPSFRRPSARSSPQSPRVATTCGTPRSTSRPRSPRCWQPCKPSPRVAHAGLSGSGATCFALFETVALAAEAQAFLARSHDWWSWAGTWFDSADGWNRLP